MRLINCINCINGCFLKLWCPNMDGLFHGKSTWNGWFGGTSILGNTGWSPQIVVCPLNNICFAYVYFIYIYIYYIYIIYIIYIYIYSYVPWWKHGLYSHNGNGHLHLPIFIEIYRDWYGAVVLFQDSYKMGWPRRQDCCKDLEFTCGEAMDEEPSVLLKRTFKWCLADSLSGNEHQPCW